jgi:hypothetical protein
VLIYVAARLLSTGIFLGVASGQQASPWAGTSPGYLDFVGFWDGGWYRSIHDSGYPSELPRESTGRVAENAWAFYILFPAAVRAAGLVTGLGWEVLAPVLATICGGAAAVVAYRLFRLRADHAAALWATAFFAFSPVSPILQVPYAEALHTLLLAAALYLVCTRRYLAAVPVVVLMCLARPAGVPFAAMLGALLLGRLGQVRRNAAPNPAASQDAGRLAVLTVAAGAAALAWPAAAWVVTGERDAYVATETAWRGGPLVPFQPWIETAQALAGPTVGVVLLVLAVLGVAAVLLSPPARRLGPVLQLWCAAYLLYLLVFLDPQTSTYRLLLPVFPLLLPLAWAMRTPWARAGTLLLCVVLQLWWVAELWAWSPLPGGGDYPP